jgi:hypothetical protein
MEDTFPLMNVLLRIPHPMIFMFHDRVSVKDRAQEMKINLTTLLTSVNYVLWLLTCADLCVVGCEPQNYRRSEFYDN